MTNATKIRLIGGQRRARGWRLSRGALISLPLVWCAQPAQAQIADPYRAQGPVTTDAGLGTAAIDVTERTRPEFQPVGGRLGSFFLYPTFELNARYTDNVFGVDVGKQDDLVITPRVGASLKSNWSRHQLTADGYALANRFVSLGSQNSEGFGAHVLGRYDVDHASRAIVDLRFDRNAEDRLNVNSANSSLRPIIFRSLVGSVRGDTTFGRFGLTGRYQHTEVDYDAGELASGVAVPQNFRNIRRNLVTGVGQYRVPGGFSAIVAVSYDTIKYPVASVFDRDSDGYRVEGGIGVEITSLLSGEVRLGYLSRNNDSPLLPNPSGVSFFANLLWNVAPTVSVRLNANRDIDDSGSPQAAGNLRSEVRLTGGWEVRRELIISPILRYSKIDPVGLLRSNDEYDTRIRATYNLNRRYRLTGEVGHFYRTAGQYTKTEANLGLIGLGVTL